MTPDMSFDQIDGYARLILDHCVRGAFLSDLPEPRLGCLSDAYAVQERIYTLREDARSPAAGWFASATNAEMRTQLDLPEPYAARWRARRFLHDGATLAIGPFGVALEAEVCFEMGRDLPPRDKPYDSAEVLDAVLAVRPGLEVVVSCFADWINQRPFNLIAEGGTEQWLVLGERAQDWRALPLAEIPVAVHASGGETLEGSTSQVMDGPASVLIWLANHAASRGEGLRAGQVCNTGMCAPVYFTAQEERVQADFGPLGQVTVQVSPASRDETAISLQKSEMKGNKDHV